MRPRWALTATASDEGLRAHVRPPRCAGGHRHGGRRERERASRRLTGDQLRAHCLSLPGAWQDEPGRATWSAKVAEQDLRLPRLRHVGRG